MVSTILGTATALALERFRFRGQRVYDGLVYLPIIIPDVTMAVMMLLFFAQTFRMLEGVFGGAPSTTAALAECGKAMRKRFSKATWVAITGSNGKTIVSPSGLRTMAMANSKHT